MSDPAAPPISHSRYFPRYREMCLSFENSEEVFQWGCIVYKVRGKVLAIVGPDPPLSVTLKADPEKFDRLIQKSHIKKAAYVGRFKWATVTARTDRQFEELLALTSEARDLVSGKRAKKNAPAKPERPRANPFLPQGDPGAIE